MLKKILNLKFKIHFLIKIKLLKKTQLHLFDFFQASEIARLTNELQKYENNHLVMQELASEVNDLFQANKSSLKSEPEVDLVRAISYNGLVYNKHSDIERK